MLFDTEIVFFQGKKPLMFIPSLKLYVQTIAIDVFSYYATAFNSVTNKRTTVFHSFMHIFTKKCQIFKIKKIILAFCTYVLLRSYSICSTAIFTQLYIIIFIKMFLSLSYHNLYYVRSTKLVLFSSFTGKFYLIS